MDFWNRLIGGSGTASSILKRKEQPPPTTADERLVHFKRLWQKTLHAWRNARDKDDHAQDIFHDLISELNQMLKQDQTRSNRTCMNAAYEQQMYIALSKIACGARGDVVAEVLSTFTMLVDNEDENFLGQESFADSLMDLLRYADRLLVYLDDEFMHDYVQLLFNITAKIRLTPSILPVWFSYTSAAERGKDFNNLDPQTRFAGVTNKDDFPLFYLLIGFVYREGRVGDFARTGLLYIIEAASPGSELERWMVESDLATLMATGLGALYSQLSRKLVMTYSEDEPPLILTHSDYKPPEDLAAQAEPSTSPEFQMHLDTFLSYLIFWQDVLAHCKSVEVKETLLDHFQLLFLQQLLYPSLLESSDIDGGSAVAVLTYVRVILDTLEHPDIIHLILSYLMNLPDQPPPPPAAPQAANIARRRKSMDLLTIVAKADSNPSPDLFNLVDLILTSLKSRSQQTVTATLRLVSILLRKHHQYTLSTLMKVRMVDSKEPQRTIGAHNKEINMLLSMIGQICPDDDPAADPFEPYLKDNLELLECHPCSARWLANKSPFENLRNLGGPVDATEVNTKIRPRDPAPHTLRPEDPFLKIICGLLETFFANSVETNLILTAVVVDMATCCYMRPTGWLLFDPAEYQFDDDEDDKSSSSGSEEGSDKGERDGDEEDEWSEDEYTEDDDDDDNASDADSFDEFEREQMRAMRRAKREPRCSRLPPIMRVLQNLTAQIEAYKREIPDLDAQLHARKNAFALPDRLNEAINPPYNPPSSSSFPNNIPFFQSSSPAPSNSRRPLTAHLPPRPSSSRNFDAIRNLISNTPPPPSQSGSGASTPQNRPHTAIGGGGTGGGGGWGGGDPGSRRVRSLHPRQFMPPPPDDGGSGDDAGDGGEGGEGFVTPPLVMPRDGGEGEFSLSHLLTNCLVLQEFMVELTALIQVRASLFAEVKFVA